MSNKKPTWKEIEEKAGQLSKTELMELLQDLYLLLPENQDFFHARFLTGDLTLSGYKRTVREAVNPELEAGEDIHLKRAEKAIDHYCRATDNIIGEAELRVYFVECGNDFTLSYGDIDEEFYDALLEMYERAVEIVQELPAKNQEVFKSRFKKLMKSSDGIGWGYHDGLCDVYCEAFPEG